MLTGAHRFSMNEKAVMQRPARAKVEIDPSRRVAIGREKRARTRARILNAAFALFGREGGLFTRVEELCLAADVTRQTFYNHFNGMDELRSALTDEVNHDFLVAVSAVMEDLDDPAERAATAIRHYLEKAARDQKWGWSMVNISSNGIIFGLETYKRAEQTVREGIHRGVFTLSDARLGRDLIMGTALSAVVTQLREAPGSNYSLEITRRLLLSLGVSPKRADELVSRPLRPLLER